MRYYLIAGEASGDLHASNLMKSLKRTDPEAEFRFRGGDLMVAVGGTLVRHYKEGAVMGFGDVLSKGFKLLSDLDACKKDILEWKPDAVILIDYPGFNLKIAKFAHKKGIKVFYYIAPKTWASRSSRNKALKKYVDMLYIVFPFEVPYFTEHEVPFVYKGNPLVEAVSRTRFGTVCDGRYVAILPGSRKGEISRMMPVCMEVADQLHKLRAYRDIKFIVAGAPSRSKEDYAPYLKGRERYVRLVFGKTYSVLKGAEAAIVNSGTASLEAALIGTPQLVGWSTSPVTIFIAKHILKVGSHVKYISLGNLIVDRPVFREFIQDDFNPASVRGELLQLLDDEFYRKRMIQGYDEIRNALGGGSASRSVARDMFTRLGGKIVRRSPNPNRRPRRKKAVADPAPEPAAKS